MASLKTTLLPFAWMALSMSLYCTEIFPLSSREPPEARNTWYQTQAGPPSGSVIMSRLNVYATSSAVRGYPLENFTPERIVKV